MGHVAAAMQSTIIDSFSETGSRLVLPPKTITRLQLGAAPSREEMQLRLVHRVFEQPHDPRARAGLVVHLAGVIFMARGRAI